MRSGEFVVLPSTEGLRAPCNNQKSNPKPSTLVVSKFSINVQQRPGVKVRSFGLKGSVFRLNV